MADRFQDLPMPVLLREARDAYTRTIRGRLARGGASVEVVGGAYGEDPTRELE